MARASQSRTLKLLAENRALVAYEPLAAAEAGQRERLTDDEWRKIARYLKGALSANTERAYRAAWADFSYFCALNKLRPLPAAPETISLYLTTLADGMDGHRPKKSTIAARLAAISTIHSLRHADNAAFSNPAQAPLVKRTLQGILRDRRDEAPRQVDGLTLAQMEAIIDALEAGPSGDAARARDKALLLVGFAGAFRRSELAGVQLRHIERTTHGVRIAIPFSKTDQRGAGMDKYINRAKHAWKLCPVRALDHWISVAGISVEGPDAYIFRGLLKNGRLRPTPITPLAVAQVVKRSVRAIGLDPARFAGHSLRAGFVTEALALGNPEWKVRAQTGHRSSQTLQRYIRRTKDGSDAAELV